MFVGHSAEEQGYGLARGEGGRGLPGAGVASDLTESVPENIQWDWGSRLAGWQEYKSGRIGGQQGPGEEGSGKNQCGSGNGIARNHVGADTRRW